MRRENSFLNNLKIGTYYLGAVLLYILPGLPFTTSLIYNLFVDPGLNVFLGGLSNFISLSLNLIFCGNYSSIIFADPFSGGLLGPPGCPTYFFIFIFIIIGFSLLAYEHLKNKYLSTELKLILFSYILVFLFFILVLPSSQVLFAYYGPYEMPKDLYEEYPIPEEYQDDPKEDTRIYLNRPNKKKKQEQED